MHMEKYLQRSWTSLNTSHYKSLEKHLQTSNITKKSVKNFKKVYFISSLQCRVSCSFDKIYEFYILYILISNAPRNCWNEIKINEYWLFNAITMYRQTRISYILQIFILQSLNSMYRIRFTQKFHLIWSHCKIFQHSKINSLA